MGTVYRERSADELQQGGGEEYNAGVSTGLLPTWFYFLRMYEPLPRGPHPPSQAQCVSHFSSPELPTTSGQVWRQEPRRKCRHRSQANFNMASDLYLWFAINSPVPSSVYPYAHQEWMTFREFASTRA